MEHNPLSRAFERKLEKLSRFSAMVEAMLEAEVEALNSRVVAEAESVPMERQQDFYEYHAEDNFELSEELPTIARYSVLTGADSALEVYLNDTCETYAKVHAASVQLGDLRGGGIERARVYLKKVAGIPFPDQDPSWVAVARLHELRNSVVHADGVIPHSRKDLLAWCGTVAEVRANRHGVVSLRHGFSDAAIAAYRSFAVKVDEACSELRLWESVFPPVEDA